VPHQPSVEAKVPLVMDMWNGGVQSVPDIAAELNLSEPIVRKILREHGIRVGKVGSRRRIDQMTQEELDEFVKDYNENMPVKDICVKYHMVPGTLYMIIRELGIVPRSRAVEAIEARNLQMDTAVEMYQEGWVLWYITSETGIDPPRLMAELGKRGMQKRGRGSKGRVPEVDPESGRYVGRETE
jgi:hypothetical protein